MGLIEKISASSKMHVEKRAVGGAPWLSQAAME